MSARQKALAKCIFSIILKFCNIKQIQSLLNQGGDVFILNLRLMDFCWRKTLRQAFLDWGWRPAGRSWDVENGLPGQFSLSCKLILFKKKHRMFCDPVLIKNGMFCDFFLK